MLIMSQVDLKICGSRFEQKNCGPRFEQFVFFPSELYKKMMVFWHFGFGISNDFMGCVRKGSQLLREVK